VKKIGLVIFIIFFAFQSCDEEMVSRIPLAPVNVILDLTYRDRELNAKLAYKLITQARVASEEGKLGYGGILVINGIGLDGIGLDPITLFAYDLSCPIEVSKDILIIPDNAGRATCPKCGAVYNIADGYGTPVKNTKSWLKTYKVSPINVNTKEYRVSN
jgi:hypothetical protein